MRRLFSSTGLPAQGAVPRDFASPTACLSTPMQSPVTPPGCNSWTVTDNSYGALPKSYPLSVDKGTPYYSFFATVTFAAGAAWTNMWSQLSLAQRTQITEAGCYCNTEGSSLPTMTIGTPRPPQVTPLPFFWMPPPDPSAFADIVLPENPVDESISGCCPGTGEVPRIEVNVIEIDGDSKLQFKLITRKPPEFVFRGDDQTSNALMQWGFPKFCCGADPCDASKTLFRFIEYPAWLQDTFDPYGETPEEPLGVVPIVMDLQYDIATGKLGAVFGHQVVHNGRIVKMNWDADCPHSSDDYTYGDIPEEPGDGLAYNKDWRDTELITIPSVTSDACSANCDLTTAACTPACNPSAVPTGFTLAGEHTANDSTEAGAVAAAMAAAEAASELAIFCYVTRTGAGAYTAVAMGCNAD